MTAASSFALFDTAIGRCAIVWRGDAVVGARLPEASDTAMRAQVARRFASAVEAAPDGPVVAAIASVRSLLAGDDVDLSSIVVDLADVSAFECSVYNAARSIPRGRTSTYGELAAACGNDGAARAVGVALGRNPVPIIIPCHRILAQAGATGGFSAPGGLTTKFRLLAIEGAGRGSGMLFDDLPMAAPPRRPV